MRLRLHGSRRDASRPAAGGGVWARPLRRARAALRAAASLLALALAAGSGTAIAGSEPLEHVVEDPHYGDTLFHFYQERYFTAVTGLMVSQHFDRVAHHADEAEVLRGGLLLSYGMHREAGGIFAKLIEQGAKPAVRDRAWYYLAKIRYQRGLLAEADEALARIGNALPPALEEERGLLQANLLLARSDYAGAAKLLQTLTGTNGKKRGAAATYARYNLGVALIRSGEAARGGVLLDELGRAGAANEEYRSLRDRANVALGFAALQDNRPENARTVLQRVRLESPHANKALLGFGWAAAALKQPQQALVPWMELGKRDGSDAAVLEARIATPYAYAELGAYGQALDGYNEAIAAFERESTQLDESIASIRSGQLVEALVERNPGDDMGWFRGIGKLPALPHASHLAPLLAEHEFQEAFKNYRDLRFLATNLQAWQDKLGVFDDMLANRRQAYAERLPEVRAQARETGLTSLRERRAQLAAELSRAEADADGVAFADASERSLLERVANVKAALSAASADPSSGVSADAARNRLRLAEGALIWRLAQARTARAWDATKALRSIDAGLEEATQRDAAITAAQRDEPARFERFAVRTAALDARLRALSPRVAALAREQQGEVQDLAVAVLQRQKERLAMYATQARFAVAQLYDRARLSKAEGHATTR